MQSLKQKTTINCTLIVKKYVGRGFWTVAEARRHDDQKIFVVTGNLMTCEPGDNLCLTGSWETHPRFGLQFKLKDFSVLTPSTIEGLVGFLSSRLSDIGRVRAIAMVKTFGPDKILGILEHHPEQLTQIDGITADRAKQIHKDYLAVKEKQDQLILLKQFQLTDWQSAQILARYGSKVKEVLDKDPYRLAEDIRGFGFKIVDGIALSMGLPKDSIARARAGVMWMLAEAMQAGHVYVPGSVLKQKVAAELQVSRKVVAEAIESLAQGDDGKVYCEENGEDEAVFLVELREDEELVAKRLKEVAKGIGPEVKSWR